MRDAAYDIARYFVSTKYEDLPLSAVEAAKKELLDTIGVSIAGASRDGVRELLELVKEWGGREQSTVISYGIKVPAPNAAQMNALMAHALDYDDGHQEALTHNGVIVVPTSLAVAELMGDINGKELITAIALGSDVLSRLGLATSPGKPLTGSGWHFTTLYGFIASAGVAGYLMKLDEEKMLNALGLAYHQTSGNTQCMIDGALSKRMGPGFSVRGGIVSALMAGKGITGARNIFEGEKGLYNIYHKGDYDRDVLIRDLGKRFEGINVGFKAYPCCGGTHVFIDIALALAEEHTISPDDIKEVKIYGGRAAEGLAMPIEIKQRPRNTVDAQFSLPWVVASSLVKGRPVMEHFSEVAVENNDVLNISGKVSFELDPDLTRHGAAGPGIIKVKTMDGRTLIKRLDNPLGHPSRPFEFEDCKKKFKDCVSYSISPLSDKDIEDIIITISDIDKVDDVSGLIKMVSGRTRL
ncbi:MAG: MmgE/PrpD family protein [Deltaproteobacteria bacterium]|nr:MmgE/PrpD family protein [Deltaproteobacteria bacterium]